MSVLFEINKGRKHVDGCSSRRILSSSDIVYNTDRNKRMENSIYEHMNKTFTMKISSKYS